MKLLLCSVFCLFITASLFAQKKDWKEMTAFHEVMAKTFHPSEEGNLQPTKDNIEVLITKSKAWQASAIPKGYNAKLVKPVLNKLVTQCVALKQAIAQKKSDDDLKGMISAAHDTFHEIMEKCKI